MFFFLLLRIILHYDIYLWWIFAVFRGDGQTDGKKFMYLEYKYIRMKIKNTFWHMLIGIDCDFNTILKYTYTLTYLQQIKVLYILNRIESMSKYKTINTLQHLADMKGLLFRFIKQNFCYFDFILILSRTVYQIFLGTKMLSSFRFG